MLATLYVRSLFSATSHEIDIQCFARQHVLSPFRSNDVVAPISRTERFGGGRERQTADSIRAEHKSALEG